MCHRVTDFGQEVVCIERHARRIHADVYICTERVCYTAKPSLDQRNRRRILGEAEASHSSLPAQEKDHLLREIASSGHFSHWWLVGDVTDV